MHKRENPIEDVADKLGKYLIGHLAALRVFTDKLTSLVTIYSYILLGYYSV